MDQYRIFAILNTRQMNWILLIIAGLCEVGFTTCLGKANQSEGNTFAFWITGFFLSLTLSMYLLYKATSGLNAVPLGSGYAVWTGIGAVGTVLVGILFFKEPVTFWRVFFIFTLIGSVVGLKLVSH
jgi:quaternary ammonium compound-resistance protein SugE